MLQNIYTLFVHKVLGEIFLNIFPQFIYYQRLKTINNLEKKMRVKYDKDLILSSFIVDKSNNYEYFCHKYKASNNTKNRLKNISTNFEKIKNKNFYNEANIKKLIYLLNKNYANDLLLFSVFINNKIDIELIERLLNFVANSEIPKFPISGEYLKKHGYETGKILGKKLKSLEEKWIENNFIIEKKVIEKSLGKTSKN